MRAKAVKGEIVRAEVTRATFLHSIIVHLNIKVRDVLILHPKTKAALNLC